jgi:hypothetical protein
MIIFTLLSSLSSAVLSHKIDYGFKLTPSPTCCVDTLCFFNPVIYNTSESDAMPCDTQSEVPLLNTGEWQNVALEPVVTRQNIQSCP